MPAQAATVSEFAGRRQRLNGSAPPVGSMTEAEAVAAVLPDDMSEADASSEATHGASDPGLAQVDQLRKRMRNLLEGAGENALIRLTKLRDAVDDLMREHRAEIDRLDKEFDRYAFLCQRTVGAELLMNKALEDLKGEIGKKISGPTITHREAD